jgi:pimeloyl-ACP methyl ester carboxylesterase
VTTTHGWNESGLRVALQTPTDTTATVGVVICPPIGQDNVVAYRALRLVADELEARGIASVRYDPAGHGDSIAAFGADTWTDSAIAAAGTLARAGASRIAFLGLTSGALAASAAAAQLPDTAALVLWDAPQSGRSWLRKARALTSISVPGSRVVPGGESVVGADLRTDEMEAIAAMRIVVPQGVPTLVAARPNATAGRATADAEQFVSEGLTALLDGTSMSAVIPGDDIAHIAAWIASTAADASPVGSVVADPRLAPAVQPTGGVRERILRYGPDELFAVESTPSTTPVTATSVLPTVLLHNGAAEHRVGANDYQVTLARLLAADGYRVVRVDRRGTGESGTVSPDEPNYLYAQEWIDDQRAVLTALDTPSERLAIVGMCAGAWVSSYAAEFAPRAVVQIASDDYRADAAEPGAVQAGYRGIERPSPRRAWLQARWNTWVPERMRRTAEVLRGPRGSVRAHLRALAAVGTRVEVVLAPVDLPAFADRGGLRAVRSMPGVRLVEVSDGDHTLFSPAMRDAVIETSIRVLRETIGTQPPAASAPSTSRSIRLSAATG